MYSFKRYGLTLFLSIAFIQICFAQTSPVSDSLSVFNKRIQVAKLANNNKSVLQTYFGNSFIANTSFTANEDFQQVTQFNQQGIDFAKSINDYEYVATGYTQIAGILRKRKDFDAAIRNALLAVSHAENIESDSVKASTYIELGDCYQGKSELVESSKSFTKAFDLALNAENHTLQSRISYRLAFLYQMAGDTAEAVRQLNKSVAVNKKNQFGEGLLEDYTRLGTVTDDARYLDTVFTLADSLGLQKKIFKAKNTLLNIYSFVYKDPKRAMAYINSNNDIKDGLMKQGLAVYYYYLGQMFRAGNMADSGLHYLKLAEPGLIKKFDVRLVKDIYLHMAACYQLKNDRRNAIYFYEKMLGYSREYGDRPKIAEVSDSLSSLYNQIGQFKKAYEYKLLATEIGYSLANASKKKELVLLEIARERKKHDDELRQEEERMTKKRNLQYMGITIAICIIFLLFLLLGMFPVSKLVIRIFGFIYFICVFEFIILLIEHSVLHPITHGDPLKLWLLKIVLIALLVPLQQVLEHKLIKFLQSRKLHHVRTKFMGMKWWAKKKPVLKPEISEDMVSE